MGEDGPGSETSRQHLGTIARGGALNLGGAAVSAIAGFALTLVVTNGLSRADAGAFFTATSIAIILTGLASLGTETGLGRFSFRYLEGGRPGDLWGCLRAARSPVLVVSLVAAAALLILRDDVSTLLSLGEDGAAVVGVLALTVPITTAGLFYLAATRAFGDMRPTVVIDKLGRSFAQPVLAVGAILLGAGLLGVTVAWSVPYVAALLLAVWTFRRARRWRPHTAPGPTRPYREIRSEFWRFTWARGVAQFAQVAIQRADIVIVAILLGAVPAAIYTAATRFVTLGQFGTQAIQQVLQPQFSQLVAQQSLGDLREVFRVSTAWTMAVGWPVYAIVGSAHDLYLGLFGPTYRDDGAVVVVVMALAMLFAVATGPVDTLLLMAGRSHLSLANSLVALAADIVLCVALVPVLGLAGAALAWLVAITLRASLALVQVRRSLRVWPVWSGAVEVAAANLVCFAVPLLTISALGADVLATLAGILVGVLVYAGWLWGARRRLALDSVLDRRLARARS